MSQFNISFRLDWPSEWADYFFRLKLKILTWYLSMVLFHFIGSNWNKWIQNIARGYLGYFGKVPLVDTKLEFFTSTEKSNSLIYSSNQVQNWYKNGAFLFLPRQSPGEPIILFEHLRTKVKILQFLTLAHMIWVIWYDSYDMSHILSAIGYRFIRLGLSIKPHQLEGGKRYR